jgi:ATP-dependent exoDNAse (exonuclease V) beta subunit
VTDAGVRFSFLGREDVPEPEALVAPAQPARQPVARAAQAQARAQAGARRSDPAARGEPRELAVAERPPPVRALSYSSLAEYERCGYRFYVERVLGLPPRPATPSDLELTAAALSATERGVLVHALLERLDFRRPVLPTAGTIAALCRREGIATPTEQEADDLARVVDAFARSPTRERLARATQVRREERFAFPLAGAPGVLVSGALDVLAREPGRMLVVDYKTDRLEGAAPADVVEARYRTQRLIYALAVLRTGADAVEVEHLFLERPDQPVSASLTCDDKPRLEDELFGRAGGIMRRRFAVTEAPQRPVCEGCPAEGGLCSWPLELTRREAPDRLF